MSARPAVRLEPLEPSHADDLFGPLAEPALYAYLDESPPPSLDWLRERFRVLSGGAPAERDERWLNWVIIDPDGRPVGTTQATVRSDAPTSIAYVLGRPDHGQGFARAAVGRMLDILRDDYGVVEVQAEIAPANVRSIRLVEALGFVEAGRIGPDHRYARRLSE